MTIEDSFSTIFDLRIFILFSNVGARIVGIIHSVTVLHYDVRRRDPFVRHLIHVQPLVRHRYGCQGDFPFSVVPKHSRYTYFERTRRVLGKLIRYIADNHDPIHDVFVESEDKHASHRCRRSLASWSTPIRVREKSLHWILNCFGTAYVEAPTTPLPFYRVWYKAIRRRHHPPNPSL